MKMSRRKNILMRPIAMLLVFVLFLGVVPESVLGALGEAWAAGEANHAAEILPLVDEAGNIMPAGFGNQEVELLDPVPPHLTWQQAGLKPVSQAVDWDVWQQELIVTPAMTETTFRLHSEKGSAEATENTVTIQAGVEATIYLDNVFIATSEMYQSAIYVEPNATLHLIICEGSENKLVGYSKNTDMATNPFPHFYSGCGIRVPETATLQVYGEQDADATGLLSVGSNSHSAIIGGLTGNRFGGDDEDGESAGQITIHSGNLILDRAEKFGLDGYFYAPIIAIGGGSVGFRQAKNPSNTVVRNGGNGGTVTITGGVINIEYVENGGAAVGGGGGNAVGTTAGNGGDAGTLTITGGTVDAGLTKYVGLFFAGGEGGTVYSDGTRGQGGAGGYLHITGGKLRAQLLSGAGNDPLDARQQGATLLVEGTPFIEASSSYINGNGKNINNVVSGSVKISPGSFGYTYPTNGIYGGEELYRLTITAAPAGSSVGVPNALVSVDVNGLNGTYRYQAITDETGKAYLWLPRKTHTIYTEHSAYGKGSHEDYNLTTTRDLTIYFDPMHTSISQTPADKTYASAVSLLVEAGNSSGQKGDIEGALWFRTSTDDQTRYDGAMNANLSKFLAAFSDADPEDRGKSPDLTWGGLDTSGTPLPFGPNESGQSKTQRNYRLSVSENGSYHVLVKYLDERGDPYYTFDTLTINNIYTRFRAQARGKIRNEDNYLYGSSTGYETIPGIYGIPYDLHGSENGVVVPDPSPHGYDSLALSLPEDYFEHWEAVTTGGQVLSAANPVYELPIDASFVDPSGNNECDEVAGVKDFTKYTLTYDRINLADKWRQITAYFVRESGAELHLPVNGVNVKEDVFWAPLDESGQILNFHENGGRYIPPRTDSYYPFGYSVTDQFISGVFKDCGNFELYFRPDFGSNDHTIYIVYAEDTIRVNERYVVPLGQNYELLLRSGQTVLRPETDYEMAAMPRFGGYVETGYRIDGSKNGAADTTYTHVHDLGNPNLPPSQHGAIPPLLLNSSQLADEMTITYYYEEELAEDTGIPKSLGSILTVRWTGTHLDGSTTAAKPAEYRYGRKQTTVTVANDGAAGRLDHTIEIVAGEPAPQWVYAGPAAEIVQDIPLQADMEEATFHYAYDSSGTGIADQDQYVVERFHAIASDGTILDDKIYGAEEFIQYTKLGETYEKVPDRYLFDAQSGELKYVLAGYLEETADAEGNPVSNYHPASQTGSTKVEIKMENPVYTVTYQYKQAAFLDVTRVGYTAQNHLETPLAGAVISGSDGEDVIAKLREAAEDYVEGWSFDRAVLQVEQAASTPEAPLWEEVVFDLYGENAEWLLSAAQRGRITLEYTEDDRSVLVRVRHIDRDAREAAKAADPALSDEDLEQVGILYSLAYSVRRVEEQVTVEATKYDGRIVADLQIDGFSQGALTTANLYPKQMPKTQEEVQVDFYYTDNTVDVILHLELRQWSEEAQEFQLVERLADVVKEGVEKGSTQVYDAPSLAGYQILNKKAIEAGTVGADLRPPNLSETLSNIGEANRELTFWYESARGKLGVVLQDDDPDISAPDNEKRRYYFEVNYDDLQEDEQGVRYLSIAESQLDLPQFYQYAATVSFPLVITWEEARGYIDGERDYRIPIVRDRADVVLWAYNAAADPEEKVYSRNYFTDGDPLTPSDQEVSDNPQRYGKDAFGTYEKQYYFVLLPQLRVGEYYDYGTDLRKMDELDIPSKYTRLMTADTITYVHPPDDGEPEKNAKKIYYQPDASDSLIIEVIDDKTLTLLDQQIIPYAEGTPIDMTAKTHHPTIKGYVVNEALSQMTAIVGSDWNSKITFYMTDVRWPLHFEVYLEDEDSSDASDRNGITYRLASEIDLGDVRVVAEPDHTTSAYIYNYSAPSLFGYTWDSYRIPSAGAIVVDDRIMPLRLTRPSVDPASYGRYLPLTVQLYYRADEGLIDENYVNLNVLGVDGELGGAPLYRFSKRVPKGKAYDFRETEAIDLEPAYLLTGGQFTNGIRTVSAANLSQDYDLRIDYSANLKEVTINTYLYNPEYDGDTSQYKAKDQLLAPMRVGNVRKDTGYNAVSPTIPGYQLVDANGSICSPHSIELTGSDGVANFYYRAGQGNITVYHRDGVNGTLLATTYESVAEGESKTIGALDDLEYYNRRADTETVTWKQYAEGETPDEKFLPPFTVTLLYDRQTTSVQLVAYDTVTRQPVKAAGSDVSVQMADLRVKENVNYAKDPDTGLVTTWLAELTGKVEAVNPDYSLAAQGSTIVAVGKENEPVQSVQVWYNPPNNSAVLVEVYERTGWQDAEETIPELGVVPLQTYTLPAALGETVTLDVGTPGAPGPHAPEIPGYRLAETGHQLTAIPGQRILILMEDIRPVVTVRTFKADQPGSLTTTKRADQNPYPLYVPYEPGYGLVRAEVYLDEQSQPSVYHQETALISLESMTQKAVVDLYYDTVDKVVDRAYVTIEIIGKSENTELYRYTIKEQKYLGEAAAENGEGNSNAEVAVKPLNVYGYEVEVPAEAGNVSPADYEVALSLAQSGSHTFEYQDLATYVTIQMVEENGDGATTPVSPEFRVNTQAGAPFTYNAPHVMGYALVGVKTSENPSDAVLDATIGSLVSVAGQGQSTITFVYQKITSKITIIAREKETDQVIRIVAVDTEALGDPRNGEYTVAAPDLGGDYYRPAAGETLTNGEYLLTFAWDTYETLTLPAYYDKETTSVFIYAKEGDADGNGSGQNLLTDSDHLTVEKVRLGEVYTAVAPNIARFTLTSALTQNLRPVKNSTTQAVEGNEASFYYETSAAGELAVKAVDVSGALLQSYRLDRPVGSVVTISAPAILGYKQIVEAGDTQIPPAQLTSLRQVEILNEEGQEEVFHYEEHTVTITVNLRDTDDHNQLLIAPGFASAIKIPYGTSYTVEAPHVPGYVIDGEVRRSFTSLKANPEAVDFYYRSVTEPAAQNLVRITVTGLSGANQLYQYVLVEERDADGEREVKPLPVSGYQINVPEAWPGTPDDYAVTITLDGSQDNIRFEYENLASSVTVHMVDEGQPPKSVAQSFVVSAQTGDPFTYAAPDVAGYLLVSSSVNGAPDETTNLASLDQVSAASASKVIFVYRKITSPLTLVAVDEETEQVIRVYEYDPETTAEEVLKDLGSGSWQLTLPSLEAAYYSPVTATAAITGWNGQEAKTVTAIYRKVRKELEVYAWAEGADPQQDTPLSVAGLSQNPQILEPQRLGEAVTVSAFDVPGFVLLAERTQTLIPSDDLATRQAHFFYREIGRDEVVVKAVEVAANDATQILGLLQSYPVAGTEGSTIEVTAPDLLGYQLTAEDAAQSSRQITLGSSEAAKEAVFRYVEDMVTITVGLYDLNNDDEQGNPRGLSAPGYATHRRVARGSSYTVYAPHITGYVIQGEAEKTFAKLENGENEVDFYYIPVVDAADEEYITITIQGQVVDADAGYYNGSLGSNLLYAYEKRVEKSDIEQEVITAREVLDYLPTWILDDPDAAEAARFFKPNDAWDGETITFDYRYNQGTLTVKLYQVTDTEPPQYTLLEGGTISVSGIAENSDYPYQIPVVPGYQLVNADGEHQNRAPVTVSKDDWQDHAQSLNFYYIKASGNVHVLHVDAADHTNILEEEYATLTESGAQAELYFAASDTIRYYTHRTGDASSQTVKWADLEGETLPYTIYFYYTRNRQPITLLAYDFVTGEPIGGTDGTAITDTINDLPTGLAADYGTMMGTLDGLVEGLRDDEGQQRYHKTTQGSTLVEVRENPSSAEGSMDNKAIVWYRPNQRGSVLVQVWIEGEAGGADRLLDVYAISATFGETVVLAADATLKERQLPDYSADGYYVNTTRDTGWTVKEGTGIAIQVYVTDQRPVVTFATDGTNADRIIKERTVSGGSVTIDVPYIPGFVLETYSDPTVEDGKPQNAKNLSQITVSGVTADITITLTYVSLEERVSTGYFDVLVRGLDKNALADDAVLYEYTKRVSLADFDEAEPVLKINEVFDLEPAWVLLADELDKRWITSDQRKIEFIYENNLVNGKVYLKEWQEGNLSTATDLIAPIDYKNLNIKDNTPWTVSSPRLPGYVPVYESGADNNGNQIVKELPTLSQTETANTITFYYRKTSGNLLVDYIDKALPEGSQLVWQEQRQVTLADLNNENQYKVVPVKLPYYKEIASSKWEFVDYGDGEALEPVIYEVERETDYLHLLAYDVISGERIPTKNGTYIDGKAEGRLMEVKNYAGNLPDLIDYAGEKYTIIFPDHPESMVYDSRVAELEAKNYIPIYFDPDKEEGVPVEIWTAEEDSGPDTSDLLRLVRTYYLPAAEDEVVEILNDDQWPKLQNLGYEPWFDHSDEKLSAQGGLYVIPEGGEKEDAELDKIILVVKDLHVDIDVYVDLGNDNGPVPDDTSYRVVSGSQDEKIPVPYVAGYLAVGYDVDAPSFDPIPLNPLVNSDITLPEVDDDTKVYFYYQDAEELINDKYTWVTVRGVMADENGEMPKDAADLTEADLLFHYQKRVDRGQNVVVIADPDTELYDFAPAWEIKPGYDDADYKADLTGPTYVMDFLYLNQQRTIQVVMKDKDGSLLDAEGNVTTNPEMGPAHSGYVKVPMTITAPVVPGYQLADDFTKSYTPNAGYDNEVTFTYERLKGSLYIQLKDVKTDSIVYQYAPTKTYPTGTTYEEVMTERSDWFLSPAPPTWLYVGGETADPVEKGDELHFPLREGETTFLTFLVKADDRTIKVRHIDDETEEVIAQQNEPVKGQLGSRVLVVADPVSLPNGYVLMGAPYQYLPEVTGNEQQDVITFRYDNQGEQGIGKVYVIGLKEDLSEGIYYKEENIDNLEPGDTFYVDLPVLPGYPQGRWDQSSAGDEWLTEKKQVKATLDRNGMQFRFLYGDLVTVDIPVHATDAEGEPLKGVTYLAYTDPDSGETIAAADSTVYRFHTATRDAKDELIYAPAISGYELLPEEVDPFKIPVVGAEDQPKVIFRYQPISENYATVTIVARADEELSAADGIFKLEQLFAKVDAQDIEAPVIPGYELDATDRHNYETPDGGDNVADWGRKGVKVLNLNLDEADALKVEFYYVRYERDVTVATMTLDGQAIGDYATSKPLTVTGRINEEILVHAPVVPGYKLSAVDKDEEAQEMTQPVTVQETGENVAEFYYEPLLGNVQMQLVYRPDSGPETVLAQDAVYMSIGLDKTQVLAEIEEENLLPTVPPGWLLVDGQGLADEFTVSEDEQIIIKYLLKKHEEDIWIYYLQAESELAEGAVAEPVAEPTKQTVQLAHQNTILARPDQVRAGWVLAGDPFADVQIPETIADDYAYTFYYVDKGEDGAGQVYLLGTGTDNQFLYYQNSTPTGAKVPDRVTIAVPDREPEWTLVADQPKVVDGKVTVDLTDYTQTVEVQYERTKVTVNLNLSDATTDGRLPYADLPDTLKYLDGVDGTELLYDVVQAPYGAAFTMTAPAISGYQLVAEDSTPADAVGADGRVYLDATTMSTTQELDLTFAYRARDDYYATVTIVARADEEQSAADGIFKLEQIYAKVAAQDIEAPVIPGYELDAADSRNYETPDGGDTAADWGRKGVKVLNLTTAADHKVEFYYVRYERDVTIATMTLDGQAIGDYANSKPLTVTGRINEEILVHAPVVEGYKLAAERPDNQPQDNTQPVTIQPTGDNIAPFYYEKLSGNVLIQLVDEDNTDTVLAQDAVYLEIGLNTEEVLAAIETQDLRPTLPAGWQLVDGLVQADDFTVSEDRQAVVKYLLAKQRQKIRVYYLEEDADPVNIKASDHVADYTEQWVHLAHQNTILAKPDSVRAGWVLKGDPYKNVQIPQHLDDDYAHIFSYTDQGEDGAGQVYLLGTGTEGQFLYYQNATPTGATVPGTVTISVPDREPYWILASEQPSGTTIVAGKVTVALTDYTKTVEVRYQRATVPVSLNLAASVDGELVRMPYADLPPSLRYVDGETGTGLLYKELVAPYGETFSMTAPNIPGYQLQAGLSIPTGAVAEDGRVDFSATTMTSGQAITFVYQETESLVNGGYVYLNIEGWALTGASEPDSDRFLYREELRVTREPEGSTIVPLTYGQQIHSELPDYELLREDKDGHYWQDDQYLVTVGAGEGTAQAPLTLRFDYQPHVTTVYVKTLLYDPGSAEEIEIRETEVYPGIQIDSTFVYDAPVLPGWQLVYHDGALAGQNRYSYTGLILHVSPEDEDSYILKFHYVEAVANQRVIQQEVDPDTGAVLDTIGIYYVPVTMDTASIDPVKVDYYRLLDDSPRAVSWSGLTDEEPEDIYVTYIRLKQNLTLTAVDANNNGAVILDENDRPITITIYDLPVMSAYDYNRNLQELVQRVQHEAAEQGYSLVIPLDNTAVYVAPESDAEKNQIKVFFRKPASGRIPVYVWIDSGAAEPWELLYGYEVPAESGDVMTLADLSIHDLSARGYNFNESKSTKEAQVYKDSSPGLADIPYQFDLIYDDVRLPVTVKTLIDGELEAHDRFKVVSGGSASITVPSVFEYAMTDYTVSPAPAAAELTADGRLLQIEGVTADTEVVFQYERSTGSEDDFLVITVSHQDQKGKTLYPTESLVRLKHATHIVTPQPLDEYLVVAAYIDGVPVEGTASLERLSVEAVEENIAVIFVYAPEYLYNGLVIIHKEDEDGLELEPADEVWTMAGQPYTSMAPYFDDYYVLSSTEELADGTYVVREDVSIGLVHSVSEDADRPSHITFTYRLVTDEKGGGQEGQDNGNVFVRAMEMPGDDEAETDQNGDNETGDDNSSAAEDADYSQAQEFRLIRPEARVEKGVYILKVPELAETDYYLFHSTGLPELPTDQDNEEEDEPGPEPVAGPSLEPDPGPAEDEEESSGQELPTEPNEEIGADADENDSGQDGELDGKPDDGPNEPAGPLEISEPEQPDATEPEAAASLPNLLIGANLPTLSRGQTLRLRALASDLSELGLEGLYYDPENHEIYLFGYHPDEDYVIDVYYVKEMIDILINPVEEGPGGTPIQLTERLAQLARKGEAALVEAPEIPGFAVSAAHPRSKRVLAIEDERGHLPETEFYYNAELTAALSITVKDKQGTLADVPIAIHKLEGSAEILIGEGATNESGYLYQNSLTLGTYRITASPVGYESLSEEVKIDQPITQPVTIVFAKETVTVPGSGGGGGGGNTIIYRDPEPAEEEEEEDLSAGLEELLDLLIAGDHIAYIVGYPDTLADGALPGTGSTVRPDAQITRAEVAQMFYTLLRPHLNGPVVINGRQVSPNGRSYSDVATGQWYTKAISTLSAYGILNGYPDGAFRPDEPITRAEFTVIVSQLAALRSGAHGFPDAVGHWAEQYIANASARGWVSGYPDGTFRPETEITRGEAASIVNRMIERRIRQEDIPTGSRRFSDLSSGHWAYEDLVEAANGHEYERRADGYEIWSKVK